MRIVYQLAGQPLAIITPCECGLTLEQIAQKDVPEGAEFYIVAAADVPSCRAFRDAWDLIGPTTGSPASVKINRAKAEAVTLDRLRIARAPRLDALDVAFMRALEDGQATVAITTDKQLLRDVTEKSLAGLSLEQLAALTLDGALAL